MILEGNCLDVLKDFPDNSIDCCVTDPPYGLSFMNKKWDYDVPSVEIWREVFRVMKPGAHLLAFGGTRTYHRMVVAIEDAGFEIRDQLQWIYSTGFPKSLNVNKSAIKKGNACGCKKISESQMSSMRDTSLSATISACETGQNSLQSVLSKQDLPTRSSKRAKPEFANGKKSGLEGRRDLQAQQGELHRSEICSVSEGISSDGTQGRLCDGTSADNGDSCRSSAESNRSGTSQGPQHTQQSYFESRTISEQPSAQTCGRCGKTIIDPGLGTALKPANEPIVLARKPLEKGLTVAENVLKWGCGGLNIDGTRIEGVPRTTHAAGNVVTCEAESGHMKGKKPHGPTPAPQGRWPANILFDEQAAALLGEPSRFFYVAKSSKRERNAGMGNETNGHPTVKPVKLMEYLITLVCPPSGIVLDPFCGSGSTGVAANNLDRGFAGIEMSPEYVIIAKKRTQSA